MLDTDAIELVVQGHDLNLRLQIDLVVKARSQPVPCCLAVLRHENNGRLQSSDGTGVIPGGMEMTGKPRRTRRAPSRRGGARNLRRSGLRSSPEGLGLGAIALPPSSGGQQLVGGAEELVANAVQRRTRSRKAAH